MLYMIMLRTRYYPVLSELQVKLSRPKQKLLVALLVKRTVLFLLIMTMLVLFMYAVGTGQGFMDSTQFLLLRLMAGLALLLSIGGAYGAIMDFVLVVRGGVAYLAGTAAYLVLAIFGVSLSALAAFILAVTAGND